MSLTINIYYTGKDGVARKMIDDIGKYRESLRERMEKYWD